MSEFTAGQVVEARDRNRRYVVAGDSTCAVTGRKTYEAYALSGSPKGCIIKGCADRFVLSDNQDRMPQGRHAIKLGEMIADAYSRHQRLVERKIKEMEASIH